MSTDTRTRAAVSTPADADARAARRARPWPLVAFWLLLAIAGIGGFVALTALVWSRTTIPFDQPLLDLARGWNAWSPLWNLLSLAAYLPLLAVTIAFVLWLWWRHQRREAVLAVVILVIVTACSEGVKELVARPRPPASTTVVPGVVYSFPSGHVLEVTAIFGFIAVLMWRGRLPAWLKLIVTAVLTSLVALVAIARVSLDAHYPSDVLAGFVAAVGVVAVFTLLTWPKAQGSQAGDG